MRIQLRHWAIALPLCACTTTGEGAPARSEIDAVLRAYERAYNAHDARALAQVHAGDGCYVPADGDVVVGHAALETYWSRRAGSGLVLELFDFETSGDVGWAIGDWTGAVRADGSRPHGRFALGLRRVGGAWNIAFDMNNEARR